MVVFPPGRYRTLRGSIRNPSGQEYGGETSGPGVHLRRGTLRAADFVPVDYQTYGTFTEDQRDEYDRHIDATMLEVLEALSDNESVD